MKGIPGCIPFRTVSGANRLHPACDHAVTRLVCGPGRIVATTGIAGLALGGGTGYLTRKYGLTHRQLDRSGCRAGRRELCHRQGIAERDLFWALRGGGEFRGGNKFPLRAQSCQHSLRRPIFWKSRTPPSDAVVPKLPPTSAFRALPISWTEESSRRQTFSQRALGKTNLCLDLLLLRSRWSKRGVIKPNSPGLPPPVLDWIGADAFPGSPELVRSAAA